MSIDARLNKLSPVLSARERAVLSLKSLKDKTPEDPSWRRTMPREQTEEFNRLISLMNACNVYLPLYISVLHEKVEQLYLRFDIERMGLLEKAAALLEEDYPEDIAKYTVRPWSKLARKQKQVSTPTFLRSLSADVREDAFKELCVRWQELRAVEIVAAEIAQSFDGEDPLPPEIRQQVDATRLSVAEIRRSLFARPRRLPEPSEDFMDRTRDLVDQGFRALNLIEEQ